MARVADNSTRACSNCSVTGENVKLCYCKTKMICSKECWGILCSSSVEYKLSCESEMAKLKADLYKDESRKKLQELKLLTGSDDKHVRDPATGRFLTNKKDTTEKDKARQATNSASKQKGQVLIHLKKYAAFRPRNQLAVREIRPNGKAVYWYRTSGYDPITSKTAPLQAHQEPNEEIQSDEDDSIEIIDIENRDPNAIIQERRDLSKTNCSLCHESIGGITGRVKCNKKACNTKSSMHLSCAGFYPANATERKIIQKSYFCKIHKPVPEEAGDAITEQDEAEGEGEAIPSENLNTSQIRKPKASGKTSVKLSLDFATILAPYLDIPADRKLSQDNYKKLFRKYVEQNKLKDPDSCLHMRLDEKLANFVGQTAGSKMSLVLFKKQILKAGHLTNVISSEGEGDRATTDAGNEIEHTEESQELPMALTPVIETPENQLIPIPGPSGGTDFQFLGQLNALENFLSPQRTVLEETLSFASF